MQNPENLLIIEDVVLRKHLKERDCLWLPVPLPVVSDVSSDVALWLFELRHLSDSNDTAIADSVKLSANCEDSGDDCKIDGYVACEENCESSDETAVQVLGDSCDIDNYIESGEISCKEKDGVHEENKINNSKLYNESEETSKEHIEITTQSRSRIKNWLSNDGHDDKGSINLALLDENQELEEYQSNKNIDNSTELTKELENDCKQNISPVKTPEIINNENPKQDIETDIGTQSVLEDENLAGNSQQNENSVNVPSTINNEHILEENKIHDNDEKTRKLHIYGGGELASCSQTHRSATYILWEANPLYGAVGDIREEGSGRGFRKLCHSSMEELGNSVSNGPANSVSPIFVQDEKLCDNIVNATSDNCESESDSMHVEVNAATSEGIEDNSSLADSVTVCLCDKGVEYQCSQIHNHESADIYEVTVGDFKNEESDRENDYNCNSVNGSFNRDRAKMSYDEQCEEVLNDLERVIQSLEVDDEELQDYDNDPDNDFLELCKEADDLAEESIQQCPPVVPVIPRVTVARSITMSSDLSDDVFVNSPSKEEGPILYPAVTEVRRHHSLDINTIFDDGTKPPVPPARKKRTKDKDRYKTVPQINSPSLCVSTNVTKALNEEETIKFREIAKMDEFQPNDSTMEIENNVLNFENQPQELTIIKRVTDMTKEKRNAKATSQYEDANSCCEQCQAGECNLSTCAQNTNIIPIPSPTSSAPSIEENNSITEETGQVLGLNKTPLRPIFTVEFPPSENVYKRHSAIPILDNKSVNSCDDSGISLPSDSVLRVRKGSTSSDIEAWKQELQLSGLCYLDEELDVDSMFQQEEWFSSNDSEGRIYFFEENSNESSWNLPELRVTTCDSPTPTKDSPEEAKMGAKKLAKEEKRLEGDVQLRSDQLGKEPEAKNQGRMAKAHSMALLEWSSGKQASSKSSSFPRNWPQLWDGNMCVLKEGALNRTKITENGKKLRKNWAPAHVVLTELLLLFFKDAKTFAAMKNAQGETSSAARPEFSVDLNGALLEHGEKASSRRNVFLISTVLGLQVLVQCDNGQQEEEWYQAIHKAITDLPSAYDSCPRIKAPKLSPSPRLGSHSPEEFKKSSSRIGRSRSVKSAKLSAKEVGSQEDLTISPDENQTKIKNRLKKFFHRRPTKDVLVKKGIYKDEPVFGCLLADVCKGESPKVPAFVQRCIAAIECKEENMKTDGLYRASGNLSQVQKIRLQVDQNNLAILELEEDVHVLTGALKLFFRELKKPLIPFECFNKALKASTNQNKKEKLQQFRDIVKALPHPNRDTLEFLLRHLLRVTKYQDSNRMHIPNLAIVFGPTLMWPESESLNMALDLMQQNLVIECFLQEFDSIFR